MNEIKVTITINESEYEGWRDYANGGLEKVKSEIEKDISKELRFMGIRYFNIEVTSISTPTKII